MPTVVSQVLQFGISQTVAAGVVRLGDDVRLGVGGGVGCGVGNCADDVVGGVVGTLVDGGVGGVGVGVGVGVGETAMEGCASLLDSKTAELRCTATHRHTHVVEC